MSAQEQKNTGEIGLEEGGLRIPRFKLRRRGFVSRGLDSFFVPSIHSAPAYDLLSAKATGENLGAAESRGERRGDRA